MDDPGKQIVEACGAAMLAIERAQKLARECDYEDVVNSLDRASERVQEARFYLRQYEAVYGRPQGLTG